MGGNVDWAALGQTASKWGSTASQVAGAGGQLAMGIMGLQSGKDRSDLLLKANEERIRARRRHATRLWGAQIAGYAAGGVDVNRGTPVDVIGQTALFEAMEIEWLRFEGELAAWNAEMDAGTRAATSFAGAGQAFAKATAAWPEPPEEIPEGPDGSRGDIGGQDKGYVDFNTKFFESIA